MLAWRWWAALAVVFGLLALPTPGHAERGGPPRVGFLAPLTFFLPWTYAVNLWLAELGYVEGRNVAFERAYVGASAADMSRGATRLLRSGVRVIVTAGTPAVRAARHATDAVPIVMVTDEDPRRAELVTSLERPGANVTGMVARIPQLDGARLAMLRDVVPDLQRVALLEDPANPDAEEDRRLMRAAARPLGLEIEWLDVWRVESALGGAARERPQALVVLAATLPKSLARRVTGLARRHRLPAVYPARHFVDLWPDGGLMSYGPSPADLSRRLARYVDRVLKGAKPADLPIGRPARYELVVNLKVAEALGLTIPASLILRADEVIR